MSLKVVVVVVFVLFFLQQIRNRLLQMAHLETDTSEFTTDGAFYKFYRVAHLILNTTYIDLIVTTYSTD